MSLESVNHPEREHADIIVDRWHNSCCSSDAGRLGAGLECASLRLAVPPACPMAAKPRLAVLSQTWLASSPGHSGVMHRIVPAMQTPFPASPLLGSGTGGGEGGERWGVSGGPWLGHVWRGCPETASPGATARQRVSGMWAWSSPD